MVSDRVAQLRERRFPPPPAEPLTKEEFDEASYSKELPLIEDEDATWVLGYGHIDKLDFSRLVNHYDRDVAGLNIPPDEVYTVSDVWHGRAVCVGRDPDIRYRLAVSNDDPDKTFPITGIYR